MSTVTQNTPKFRYWDHPLFKWLALAMAAMIYIMMRSRFVGFNDSLSFLLEAESGFSPFTNATSHFLYNNIQHLLVSTFAFAGPVFVMTMFSIACSVLALVRIYQLSQLLAGVMPTNMMPPMIIGLSFTFWQQTEIIEVYAFNNLLFLNFLYFALKDLLKQDNRHLFWTSLFLFLGVLTHIQNILSIPFFLYYLYQTQRKKPLRVLSGLGILLLAFVVLIIPPLAANTNSISSIFFDNNFQGQVLGFSMSNLGAGMLSGMAFLMYNFHMFLFFILHGWYLLWRDRRQVFYSFLMLFIPYFGFAVQYGVVDNHVFYLLSYFVLVLPSIFSFNHFAFKLMPYMGWMIPMMMMMGPMMYMGATMMAPKIEVMAKYDQEKAYKGGVKHLLWPGKMSAKDPLALALRYQKEDPEAYEKGLIEWNYPAAIDYLELKGEL